MNVISFSLWGNKPAYTIGAIRNADIAQQLFPDWLCVYYCFPSVPIEIISQLQSRKNVIIRPVESELAIHDNRGMFYRFLPADESGIERMMSRDTDSRLSERERIAVDEWLASGTDVHVMRDHPYHGVPILGGMWGVKGQRLKGLRQAILDFSPTLEKGQDQLFLQSWVWEKILRGELSCSVHDPFFQGIPFPHGAKRGEQNAGVWFVGQVFDEYDRYNSESDKALVLGTP